MEDILFKRRKELRSLVIRDFLIESSYHATVIFSCGNASDRLKQILQDTGIRVLDIAPHGALSPTSKWWTPDEVHRFFPDYFDATSGHLPLFLMLRISERIRSEPYEWLEKLPQNGENYRVPSGSGEAIMTLRWAFPESNFIPLYNVGKGTEYSSNAPLNKLVTLGQTSAIQSRNFDAGGSSSVVAHESVAKRLFMRLSEPKVPSPRAR